MRPARQQSWPRGGGSRQSRRRLFERLEQEEQRLNKHDAVAWPSKGRRASSISALLGPAAQTGAVRTACSLLPAASSAAVQASPPHHTPIASLAIPLLTHTCCYSLATADEPVNPRTVVLPSTWETTAESSLPPCRSLPRPRRRPPPGALGAA